MGAEEREMGAEERERWGLKGWGSRETEGMQRGRVTKQAERERERTEREQVEREQASRERDDGTIDHDEAVKRSESRNVSQDSRERERDTRREKSVRHVLDRPSFFSDGMKEEET
jgi:hypothetical protein